MVGDLGKVTVQVQGTDADLVSAHLIDVVGLYLLVRSGIEQHTGHRRGLGPKLRLFVLHIGEDLIEISGMQGMHIILRLRGVGVILCVDDQHLAPFGKGDVALHHGQHVPHIVVQRPRDLRGVSVQLRMLAAIVFQNELLIQAAHALLVQKVHQLRRPIRIGLQQPLDHQIADRNEHPVGLVVPMIADIPVDLVHIQGSYIAEKDQQLFQLLLAGFGNVRPQKQLHGGFQYAVQIGIHRKLVIGANQLLLVDALGPDGFRNVDPSAHRGEWFRLLDVFPAKAALQLPGDPLGKDRRAQLRHVIKLFCRYAFVALLPKDLKGIRQHVIDVLNGDHLIALLRMFAQSFTFVGSSNQYSFSSGINSYSTMLERVCSSASFRLQK